MADLCSVQSPTEKNRKPTSSFFPSPRLFTGFASKGLTDSESVVSPTSILDTKPFTAFKNKNPFWSDSLSLPRKTPKPEIRVSWEKLESKGVGLGIVDSLIDEISSDSRVLEPERRMVLFGSQLKVQIPNSVSVSSPVDSPKSPADFGIKSRNSHLGPKSPSGYFSSSIGNPNLAPKVPNGFLNFSSDNPKIPNSVSVSVSSPVESTNSPTDFGIKTRNSQLGPKSPSGYFNSGNENPNGSLNFSSDNPETRKSMNSPVESPKSPTDFGIKTKNPQLDPKSPSGYFSSCHANPNSAPKTAAGSVNFRSENPNSPRVFGSCISASEMELSEDYTCVISHGPNPRTTHIFGDCIVESCCGVVGFSGSLKGNGLSGNRAMSYPSESFLSFCYGCKRNLGLGRDIYMYRGEKAFCSSECRYKEMMLEESNDTCGTLS